MRVLSLSLPDFKNLRDFRVDFDSASPISVLVGRNGTGKSNVLEALTIIFRDLDLGDDPQFPYALSYECRGRRIDLEAKIEDEIIRRTCRVNGKSVSLSSVVGPKGRKNRPSYVFGYYSGPSNRLEEHYAAHQERFYRDLVSGIERPLRPLFYARPVHSNFVLLAFFLDDDPAVQELLRDQLGIMELDSVLFVMQQPPWTSKGGDARFWNARGTVRTLLDQLYRRALAPLRLERRVSVGLGRAATRTEQLFLYLPDGNAVRHLAATYASHQEFFKALESTYISELISDVRIRVRVGESASMLTFRELSEGEQQLLLVLGLMRFTREDESLFLLDEPDTHLNPAWSLQYRDFLSGFGALDERSHVLMATHDPLVVGGLLKNEVRILERDPNGRSRAVEPWDNPRGMGVGSLLTSDVYGLRSQLDLPTLRILDEKRRLAARSDLSDEERDRLDALNEQLEELGLLTEERDPEYQEFLRAKLSIEAEALPEVTLTRDEIAAQREESEHILRDMLWDNSEPIEGRLF
ncbi:AAA family ATPase [Micromonospora sp. NPDC005707]|uniref:AAA family ATPase n=1 Tax=Micromonospora sp. NPDC005707 TaxID=3157050 RepID=UPI0033EE149A